MHPQILLFALALPTAYTTTGRRLQRLQGEPSRSVILRP